MPQADGQVQNASFPAVRTDINDNLQALFSQSSGPSAPAVTVAFQPWIDTSTSPATWRIRNAANSGWITLGTVDSTGFAVGGITPIANGGTGATTAAAALAALLPNQTGQTGKALITDGSLATWAAITTGASVQVFTASGTYTPTPGKVTFLVLATGGGGGSGIAGGGGGGAGGTAIRLYSINEMGASATVTIGAAGPTGTNGGSTVFDPGGSGLTITGGYGAGGNNAGPGGAGGTTANSLFSIRGENGMYGNQWAGLSFWAAGPGRGASYLLDSAAGIVVVLEW